MLFIFSFHSEVKYDLRSSQTESLRLEPILHAVQYHHEGPQHSGVDEGWVADLHHKPWVTVNDRNHNEVLLKYDDILCPLLHIAVHDLCLGHGQGAALGVHGQSLIEGDRECVGLLHQMVCREESSLEIFEEEVNNDIIEELFFLEAVIVPAGDDDISLILCLPMARVDQVLDRFIMFTCLRHIQADFLNYGPSCLLLIHYFASLHPFHLVISVTHLQVTSTIARHPEVFLSLMV